MKFQTFDSLDPISILSFLSDFKLVCDTNALHEGANLWMLPFFMKHPAAAAQTERIALKLKLHKRRNEAQ